MWEKSCVESGRLLAGNLLKEGTENAGFRRVKSVIFTYVLAKQDYLRNTVYSKRALIDYERTEPLTFPREEERILRNKERLPPEPPAKKYCGVETVS